MKQEATAKTELTKNQSLVLNLLSREHGPLTAYRILDELKPAGLKAPLQVYRALEKLIEFGYVHRLESLNSFVACQHPECKGHEASAFSICETCGEVQEYSDARLNSLLNLMADRDGFQLTGSTLELRGTCAKCPAPDNVRLG